ncbi:ABC transporter permease [Mycobacterium sp. IDR2000157661]|uniref:ABC transporter permease n=1 Tax=Mycobacterium sp. IDR2000157661 TaxID=2867005 RepID=UPI001EE9C16C|nr:ABC transporter permease [Mycobacterium sp. IDR2000157661]ULE34283.1 ABC transporter permease [Mycobacterium sp. IDR2000157661]
MSALAVVNAERIKLGTTHSASSTAVVVALLALALAGLQGALSHASAPLDPQRAALGVAVFGVPVLMVMASMTVTAEYRTGMVGTTFIAEPKRTLVILAKVVVTAIFSALFAAALVVMAIALARIVAATGSAVELSPASPEVWRLSAATALYAALASALGVGIGALVRAGPGAVAVLLLWPLLVEPMLGNLPDVGAQVGPYLPFANVFLFIDVQWLYPVYAMPWGPLGSLVYFAAWVVAVLIAAIAVVNARDA